MLPKHIIFDWDDTLADSSLAMKDVMDKTLLILEKYGAQIEREHRNYWNLSLCEVVKNLPLYLKKIGEVLYFYYYQKIDLKNIKLFTNSIILLKYLKKKNVKLYIISNKKSYILHKEVTYLKVSKFFERIHGSGDSEHSKPSKEVILNILGDKKPRSSVFFVGDSHADWMSAKLYKCKFILLNHYKNARKEKRHFFDLNLLNANDKNKIVELNSLNSLLEYIKQLDIPYKRGNL